MVWELDSRCEQGAALVLGVTQGPCDAASSLVLWSSHERAPSKDTLKTPHMPDSSSLPGRAFLSPLQFCP